LCLLQLITCADNSSIGAWDIESGRKAYMVLDAHDGEEITCIAIDRQCRRIATGARNGVIKVRFYFIYILFYLPFVKIWNSANGQNLCVLPSVEDAEITGIVFADKGIITVGWSRKIVKYAHVVSDVRNHIFFVKYILFFLYFY
jgi:WD40 repeat protein